MRCHWLGAMPAQHVKASERAHEDTSPATIDVTSKSPVGDISVVTLIRTDTTLDHSRKAERVCTRVQIRGFGLQVASALSATNRSICNLNSEQLCAWDMQPLHNPDVLGTCTPLHGQPAGIRKPEISSIGSQDMHTPNPSSSGRNT